MALIVILKNLKKDKIKMDTVKLDMRTTTHTIRTTTHNTIQTTTKIVFKK